MLNDFVLLKIFAKLTLPELHVVAQCNRRLRELAQSTFSVTLNGHLTITDSMLQIPGQVQSILRIFGPLTKHFDYNAVSSHYAPLVWPWLDIAQLKTMRIDPFRMRLADIHQYCNVGERFEQLESLELYTVEVSNPSVLAFDFRLWFPRLTSLTLHSHMQMEYVDVLMPLTLRTLDMDLQYVRHEDRRCFELLLRLNRQLTHLRLHEFAWRLRPNDVFDVLIANNLHHTLESLTLIDDNCAYTTDDVFTDHQLTPRLHWFCKLTALEIVSSDRLSIVENVQALQTLPSLEKLTMPMANLELDVVAFLDAFAWAVSPQLKQFTVAGPFDVDEDDWSDFVDAMPITCKCQAFDELPMHADD